jgi:dibenzofuran dioxygenase subunit beta
MSEPLASLMLQHEIEQFLFHEVRLLDDGKFDEWLELFTDDCRYWMPVRETTMDQADAVRGSRDLPIFDDDKAFLTARVSRLTKTPMAHAEQPRSRTRHCLTNISVTTHKNHDVTVSANFIVYQSRLERTESTFVGHRTDLLKAIDNQWRIFQRKIILDQTMIPRTLSIFF